MVGSWEIIMVTTPSVSARESARKNARKIASVSVSVIVMAPDTRMAFVMRRAASQRIRTRTRNRTRTKVRCLFEFEDP